MSSGLVLIGTYFVAFKYGNLQIKYKYEFELTQVTFDKVKDHGEQGRHFFAII